MIQRRHGIYTGLTAMLVGMTACASSTDPASEPGGIRVVAQSGFASNATPQTRLPRVTADFGSQPHVAPGTGTPPAQPAMDFVSEGTGQRVTPGTKPVVRYVQTDWKTGAVSHDSWQANIAGESLPFDDATIAISSFLNGIRLGSRVEIVNPTSGGDAHVFVVDLIAQGTELLQPAPASSSS